MCLRTAHAERLAPGSHGHRPFVFEIRWINEVWLVVFLGKYGFGVLCMLRRYVTFLVYLCGICVALALWVGALYSDVLSEYKAPGCERWGEESVVLRGLPAASVLLCVARLKRTKEGSLHTRTFVFGTNSVGPFAACRLFRCRPRLWSCVMFHGVRGTLLLF